MKMTFDKGFIRFDAENDDDRRELLKLREFEAEQVKAENYFSYQFETDDSISSERMILSTQYM